MAEPRTRTEGRGGVSAADCMRVVPRKDKESGSAYAYRVLSQNIMMLYMPPGAWIREASIAEALHVSRTPVHEAMSLLRDRSLVDVAPQSATHVSRINVGQLRQSFFMRVAVEPLIVTQLARTVTPRQIDSLKSVLTEMDEVCADPYRQPEFIDLNQLFNKRLYDAAGKGYIWESLQKTGTAYERTYNMGILYGYSHPSPAMHHQIVSFLESGGENRQEVTTAIHGMLSEYTQYLERLARDFPDCFVLPSKH